MSALGKFFQIVDERVRNPDHDLAGVDAEPELEDDGSASATGAGPAAIIAVNDEAEGAVASVDAAQIGPGLLREYHGDVDSAAARVKNRARRKPKSRE